MDNPRSFAMETMIVFSKNKDTYIAESIPGTISVPGRNGRPREPFWSPTTIVTSGGILDWRQPLQRKTTI